MPAPDVAAQADPGPPDPAEGGVHLSGRRRRIPDRQQGKTDL